MADEFEWRTDVDSGWESPEPGPTQPGGPGGRRRTLIVLATVACLLLVTVLGIYRALSGRVEEATSTAESGLLLAHELLVSGALNGDQDRVMSVVAERPASWHDLLADLVSRQLLFSRRPLGLEVDRKGGYQPPAEDDIRLAPELDAAEIVDRLPYVATSRGMTETVVLEHTFFYDRTGDQWELSPPADEGAFWGNWITDERANITTTYPERDELVAIKLSGYLDTFLPAFCAAEGMDCPDDFHLVFKLERDPSSIRRLAEGVYAIRASSAATGDRLVLPAPSLIGSPVDERGYEALERGYAGWIGASIAATYGTSAAELYDVLAQFGLQQPPAPAGPMPRPATAAFPAGAVRPSQDVLLLCGEDSLDRLLRFEVDSGTWREQATGALWGQLGGLASDRPSGSQSFLSRLPDYRDVIIQTAIGQGDETTWQTYLLRDGSARLLTEERQIHYYLPPRLQPAGQPPSNLLAYYVPADEPGEGFSSFLVDLDECRSSPCQTESLPGMPIWSTGGERTVLITSQADGSQLLFLGDERGAMVAEVGIGQSPAWLDDSRFVYVSQGQTDQQDRYGRWLGQEVLLVDAAQAPSLDVTLSFDAEMVRQSMPETSRPDSLALWTVQPAAPGSSWWYVTATGNRAGDRVDYVLVYDLETGETRLALPMGQYGLVEPPMVNETGRQAVIIGLPRDGSQISVELIDADTSEVRRLPDLVPQDWSADGDWLIQLDQGVMILVSTADEAEWSIRHDLTECYWAVWTQQESNLNDS